MNNGAFGENFPYSNFHDLNMDWIIKIAKNFLDQYTHIQEVIENGEESLENLTTSGLTQLQEKADALEALLQEWYNEHSADIADQLADALEDLNEWYTTHENYLDQYVQDSITTFTQRAGEIAAETIESIPDDYTELSNDVAELQSNITIDLKTLKYVKGWIDNYVITPSPDYGFINTGFVPVELLGISKIHYTFTKTNGVDFIAFYDVEKTGISAVTPVEGVSPTVMTGDVEVPENARYFVICYKATDTDSVFTGEVKTAKSIRLVESTSQDILPFASITGEYIDENGAFTDTNVSGFRRSDFLPVKELGLQAIEYEFKSINGICMIAVYDNNKQLIDKVMTVSGASAYIHDIINLNTDAEYVAICYNTNSNYAVMKGYFTKAFRMSSKTIACFGDSITYMDGKIYGSGHSESGTLCVGYETWIRTLTGARVYNEGHDGHRMPTILPYIKSYPLSSVDIVTLTAGANDFRAGSSVETLGSIQPIGSTFDETTFCGSFQSAIESILTRKPSCKIILITPVKGWTSSSGVLTYAMPNTYPDAIKEMGKLYNLPVCDWYYESGVNELTVNTYLGDDNTASYKLHPNNLCYSYMGILLVDTLNKI